MPTNAGDLVQVSVLVLHGPESTPDVTGMLADLSAQEGVKVEVILVDFTDAGDIGASVPENAGNVRVIRAGTLSESEALHEGLAASTGKYIAWRKPGTRSSPQHLAKAVAMLEANQGIELVTTTYYLSRPGGRMVASINPALDGSTPPTGWDAGVVMRRETMEKLPRTAFFPVQLELYQALYEQGRVGNVDEALYSVDADSFALERFHTTADMHCIQARQKTFEAPDPWLSIIVPTTGDRARLRRCLDGLGRQVLPVNTYEIVVVDHGDGSTARELGALAWPVGFTSVDASGNTVGAALDAAVESSRGMTLIFVDESLTVFPDLAEQHARAHRENEPRELAVIGTTEVMATELIHALPRLLADGRVERGREALQPGGGLGVLALDRRNLSLPRLAFQAVGGFASDLSPEALDLDLAQRLNERGVHVFHRAEARTLRQGTPDLAALGTLRQQQARAFVSVLERHPDAATLLENATLTTEQLEARLVEHGGSEAVVQAAASTLAAVNVSSLEPIGDDWRQLSEGIVSRLGQLVTHLDQLWQARGWLEGLKDCNAAGFETLQARHPEGLPGARTERYLLVPQLDAEDQWLLALARYLTGFGRNDDSTLVLLANAGEQGYGVDVLQAACQELTRQVQPPRSGAWGSVVVVDQNTRERPLVRLVAAMKGWVPTGAAFDSTVAAAAGVAQVPEVDAAPWELRDTGGVAPIPLPTAGRFRVLAWPDWKSEEDIHTLLDVVGRPLLNQPDTALCLRFDEAVDGNADEALERLSAAYDAIYGEGNELNVYVFSDPVPAGEAHRLGLSAQAAARLPSAGNGPRRRFLDELGVPVLASVEEIEGQLQRLDANRPSPLVPNVTWTV